MKEGQKIVVDVTCALIIDDQDRLFTAQRSTLMSLPLKWELPGGKIEPGETARHCLYREIKEELNITIIILKELTPNTHSYPSINIRLIPFICKHNGGEIILREHADFKWLNRDQLLDLDWAEADIPIIKSYLNSINATT